MTGRIIVNGEFYSRGAFRKVAHSLSDKRILTEKGGYLFKAAFLDGDCHLGIVPWVLDSQRTHHYDIRLKHEDMFTLIGSIDARGEWCILFVPVKEKQLSDEEKAAFRRNYRETASVFTGSGLPKDTPLDNTTGLLLTETGICEEFPITLGSLINL